MVIEAPSPGEAKALMNERLKTITGVDDALKSYLEELDQAIDR